MKPSPVDDAVAHPAPAQSRSILPILYAGVVIVVALYYGQELLVPLVIASLLAFVLAPACRVLQALKLPRVLAVLTVVILASAAIGGLGVVVGGQIRSLAESLPRYQATITTKWETLARNVNLLERHTKAGDAPVAPAKGSPSAASATEHPAAPFGIDKIPGLGQVPGLNEVPGLSQVSGLAIARTVAQPLLAPLATAALVFVFSIFILLSNEDLRDRLVRLVGRQDLHRTILAMNDAARRLSRYFLFQLAVNTSFGAVIGMALWLIGLPNPLLWGILAALMRFVPFIGIFVAALPPILLAIAVVPGWSAALLVLALFAGAESMAGQVIEPLVYGHSTGLSPLAVIVATAFWALIWGPIGLLIATPLTVCLVVIGRHVEPLAFLDVILGDAPPLEPPETFYQRALEGRALELLPAARRHIAASSLTDYDDKVALPGLALAQADLARDALAFERLEAIHEQIDMVLAALASPSTARHGTPSGDALPDEWRGTGAIACIPGRGQLDDLAATMAVQTLTGAGFGASLVANLVLGSTQAAPAMLANAKVCVLSVLEKGSNVSAIRYFVRRIQKQVPNAVIVIGLWHVDASSPMLASLRAEGGDEHLVLSLGELLAFCRALAARVPELAA